MNRIGEIDIYGIEKYNWDFGDGDQTSSETSSYNSAISHVYNSPGDYTVKLTVADSIGSTNYTTKTITVLDLPKVTVDTTTNSAVIAAVNALGGQPGIIHVPSGTYDITSQINLKSGQVLEGDGIGQTIFQMPGGSGYAVSIQASNTAISGITFRSSTIQFPRAIILSYDNQRNIHKNVYIHDCEFYHLELGNTSPQVNFWDGVTAYPTGGSGLWENNTLHLNALGGAGYGIQADRGSYWVIRNNEFYSNRHSIAGAGQTLQANSDPAQLYYSWKSGYDIFNNTFHGPNAETITCPTAENDTAKCTTDVVIDMHVSGRGRIRINDNSFKDVKFGIGIHDGWGEIKNNSFENAGSGGHIMKFTEGIHNNIMRCNQIVDAIDQNKKNRDICIGAHDFNISGNTYTSMPRNTYFQFIYENIPKNMIIDGCTVESPNFTGKGISGEAGLNCP